MFLTTLLVSSLAHATPVVTKDWSIDACVASTSVTDKTGTYRLEVAIDPTHVTPLEVRVVPSVAVASGKLALDKKTIYAFAAGTDNTLWNIPRGTLNLIAYLKRSDKAVVETPLSKIAFSLKGSSVTLASLQKNCNANLEFGSDGFERAFLPAVVANVDPATLKPADVDGLKALVKTALAAYNSSATTQASLNTLTAQFLAQITEFEQLRKNLDKLTHDTVVRLQKRHDDATANIAQAQTEIPQLQAQVAQQEALVQPANQALAQAQADFAPMQSGLQRYQNAVDDADDVVRARQADLQAAQSYEQQTRVQLQKMIDGVNQAAANINSINNEIAQLRNDLQNANNYVNQMDSNYRRASDDRRRFDRTSEIQRRMATDPRPISIDNQLNDARNRVPLGQQHIDQAMADKQNFDNQLAQCRAVVPAQDCTQQDGLARRADQRLSQARNEMNDLQNRIRDLQNQRSNFRQVIENEVQRDLDTLQRIEADALAKLQDARSNAQQIANNLNQAQGPDMQAAQSNYTQWQQAKAQADSDVRNAMNGTASAQRNLSAAQSDEDAAQSRMESWKQSSGYNAKARAVSSAQATVDKISSTLNSLDRQITSRQKLIRDETQSLADTEKQMQDALTLIQQKEARSGEVAKILEPYYQQRDQLNAAKAASDQAFKDAQVAFAQALQPVAPPVVAVTQ